MYSAMRRRRFIQALAAAPAAPLIAQQVATPPAPGRGRGAGADNGPETLAVEPPDAVAEPVTRYFNPAQYATLQRLCAAIEPPLRGNPGAVECGVPEFLDFLLGASLPDRQQLYRNGLDALQTQAKKHFSKPFADWTMLRSTPSSSPCW